MDSDFFKYIHKKAFLFRQQKIKEILDKKNPNELEIYLIQRWAEHFGGDAW